MRSGQSRVITNDLPTRNRRRRHLAQHGPPSTYSMVHVMSEVKRFNPSAHLPGMFPHPSGNYVRFPSFERMKKSRDAQRLRADTAEAELKALKHPMNSAQQLRKDLAAAEQRIAELTDVERVTMAILGKDKDPSPGVNWNVHRMWRVNDVRELVRAALNPNPEAEIHDRLDDEALQRRHDDERREYFSEDQ